MVKVRNGPNWASMGLAQEALVGVKQSSTLFRAARPDGAPIYVIMDNLSANKTPAIRAWAARIDLSADSE